MLSYLHIIFSDLDIDRKFSIFGALTVLAEPSSIVNEISTFFNQFDGAITFSVIIILNQLITIRWSLWWSEAVAILNGKALGEREANKTKLCMKLRVVNSVLLSSGPLLDIYIGIFSLDYEPATLFSYLPPNRHVEYFLS